MKKGAAVLRIQIDDRKEAVLLELERKAIETKATIKAILDRQEVDRTDKLAKVQKQKLIMEQAAIYNKESLVLKQSRITKIYTIHSLDVKLKEIEQDQAIIAYTAQKEKEMIAKDNLFREKAAEKEKEVGRLRAAQERVNIKKKSIQ